MVVNIVWVAIRIVLYITSLMVGDSSWRLNHFWVWITSKSLVSLQNAMICELILNCTSLEQQLAKWVTYQNWVRLCGTRLFKTLKRQIFLKKIAKMRRNEPVFSLPLDPLWPNCSFHVFSISHSPFTLLWFPSHLQFCSSLYHHC